MPGKTSDYIKLDHAVDPFTAYLAVSGYGSMLFESGSDAGGTGSNSLVFFNPKEIVNSEAADIPLPEYIDRLGKSRGPLGTGLIFDGGFAGYLSYDYGMGLTGVKSKNRHEYKMPDCFFGYYEDYIIIDHKNGCTYIHSDDGEIQRKIEMTAASGGFSGEPGSLSLEANFSKEEYMGAVNAVKERIYQGDVYQVNISQQFVGKGRLNPYEVYSRFRRANYGPYNAFLDVGGSYVLSTSPEQLFKAGNGSITTRPIKGTIKRSADREENESLKKTLLNSDKDRAELLMIVDLERNDLSKVSVPGTVKVEKLYEVEEYSTVNHLVSTVSARLKEDAGLSDILAALFPGGSITGAPKLSAMKVIDELEKTSRGIYTGSIGYVSNNGNMDFNIAIRTAVIDGEGVRYNVGGGIVWDSDPACEYEETLHKGRAIYRVLTGKEDYGGDMEVSCGD